MRTVRICHPPTQSDSVRSVVVARRIVPLNSAENGKGFKSSIQQAYENSNVLFYMELQVQDPVVSDFRMVATGFREIVRVFSRVFGVPRIEGKPKLSVPVDCRRMQKEFERDGVVRGLQPLVMQEDFCEVYVVAEAISGNHLLNVDEHPYHAQERMASRNFRYWCLGSRGCCAPLGP